MKIIRLQVEYEKMFPQRYFNINNYKKTIQDGLLERLSNDGFDDGIKLKEHVIKFSLIEKTFLSKFDSL
jgi:hypothetical protein